jgi:hypothetical protein
MCYREFRIKCKCIVAHGKRSYWLAACKGMACCVLIEDFIPAIFQCILYTDTSVFAAYGGIPTLHRSQPVASIANGRPAGGVGILVTCQLLCFLFCQVLGSHIFILFFFIILLILLLYHHKILNCGCNLHALCDE